MKIKIKTLSPLHIGGKEVSLSPLNYVILNGKCYVINEDRLSERLYEQRKLKEFVDFVIKGGERVDIRRFLASHSFLNSAFLNSTASYFTTCEGRVYGNIKPFIRDAFARPYIPGSSIKGSLRTSIMYVILKRMKESARRKILDEFVLERINEYKKDPRGRKGYARFREKFKKWFAEKLDKSIFKSFALKGKRGYDAHYDILRYLKISDSTPLSKNSLRVEEVKIYSVGYHEGFKRWSIFIECVSPGAEFEFELNIDKDTLGEFKKDNPRIPYDIDVEELYNILLHPLEAAKEKASDLLEEEKVFFLQHTKLGNVLRFEGEEPNFRLGWGQGLLGTSIDLLLPQKVRQELRNTFFKNCGATPAPKSRRLIMNDKGQTLGWCIVKVV